MKGHIACWRKGKETLAKWLKEGKDTGGFAIEGKGKGRSMEKKRGKYSEDKQHAPLEPSDSKEEAASRVD